MYRGRRCYLHLVLVQAFNDFYSTRASGTKKYEEKSVGWTRKNV